MASYSKLSVIERAIVDVCSVFYAPAPRTDIASVLGEIGHRNAARAFKPEDVLPILRGLTEKGWLRGDTHWRVTPELAHAVIREVARQKRVELLGAAVRSIRPPKASSWEAVVRELRIELYAERWDEARRCLRELGPGTFAEICRPYDESWVSSLPEDLSSRAAKEVLERSVVELLPADEALAQVERAGTPDDSLHRVLVEQMILRGRLEDAERLLSQRTSLEADAGQAWLLAVRGRWSEAVDAYERALLRYLKACGKRARFFPDRSGAFFIVALIAKGDPASLERARVLAEAASKPQVSAISPRTRRSRR